MKQKNKKEQNCNERFIHASRKECDELTELFAWHGANHITIFEIWNFQERIFVSFTQNMVTNVYIGYVTIFVNLFRTNLERKWPKFSTCRESWSTVILAVKGASMSWRNEFSSRAQRSALIIIRWLFCSQINTITKEFGLFSEWCLFSARRFSSTGCSSSS